ncbi:alpha/beta hydrolase [Sphaerisporangium krabiense]|uniref:Dienelactone hydrolase n=1 Tax=Sphaerisporangium krabiense TaxID=763782 RepID=A0A7W8Z0B9_9ACTN|nr:alpha/beta hydrolase [Sphaerisporangium krabiense]MBB5625129.1 dienelactone hydrolase [Sphaerisporangium krabiense]GII67272.1 alpha/beta hydrolase [Sphaerisporangium krabiense]
MLNYFDDYSADLALSMALDMGANMDEIDRTCKVLRDEGTPDGLDFSRAFFHAWVSAGDRLWNAAQRDEEAGHRLSASEKYRRATIMYLTGERMPEHHYPARAHAYERVLAGFSKYVELGSVNCEKVAVPYQGSILPALMVRADVDGPAPCLVHFNGLDGLKEFLFLTGFGQALARRGVSVLFVDNPGVGEALRKHGLHNFPEAEIPASACIDYLQTRADVDPERIGMAALSMGGHHAPRATAFEPRIKCCIAWGANYDWGAQFRKRVEGAGTEKSVPHIFEHVMWVLGQNTIEDCLKVADGFTLRGVLDRITVPILITHGENDRQITVDKAVSTYEDCVNSPRRELRIFTAEEGGEQHCHIGNMSLGTDFMADWAADVFDSIRARPAVT